MNDAARCLALSLAIQKPFFFGRLMSIISGPLTISLIVEVLDRCSLALPSLILEVGCFFGEGVAPLNIKEWGAGVSTIKFADGL